MTLPLFASFSRAIARSRAVAVVAVFAVFAVAACAQAPVESGGAPKSAANAAAKAASLPRLHVIGASVSGGFRDGPMTGAEVVGETVSLQQVLKAWCGEHARATTHATMQMMAMFTNPLQIGAQQVAGAQKAEAVGVLAVDFAFWFANGYVPGDDEAKARGDLLARGLELLDGLRGPIVLGDLPDMTGASPRMLKPAQIPGVALQATLNAQIAAFAKARPNVRLLPLATLMRQLQTDGVDLPLASGPVRAQPGALLQGDQLHANRLGMAYLGWVLQPTLRSLFAAEHSLAKQEWTFEQFVGACGAEDDLAAVQAAAKGAGAKPAAAPADGSRGGK
jgi:hypothetical protein